MGKLRTSFLVFVLFLIAVTCVYAIQPDNKALPSPDRAPLVFILLPVENVSVMYEKFLPLKEHLERSISRKILLKVAQNYQEAIDAVGSGHAHIAYLDPSAYCEAKKRYRVVLVAKAILDGSSTYKSVIVARKDSPVNKIVEVKGKKLALGNVWSSSSYLIPAVMFKEVGIGLKEFRAVDYLEHEDRIALSVLSNKHDVGGLSERVAIKYIPDGLKIIKTSEAIPQYSVCAYSGLPEELRNKIKHAFLSLTIRNNPEVIKAMKDINGFSSAEDRDLDVVRVMIRNLTGKNYLEYGRNSVKVAILPL